MEAADPISMGFCISNKEAVDLILMGSNIWRIWTATLILMGFYISTKEAADPISMESDISRKEVANCYELFVEFIIFFPFLFTIFSFPLVTLSYFSCSIPISSNAYVYINPWGAPHLPLDLPIFNHIPEFTLTPPFSIYISESWPMCSELWQVVILDYEQYINHSILTVFPS